ncbi:hypothetical protein MNBD_GAMMA05-488 [hydrothermal vent metagenome]|uniref:Uncharacterized protein n=1 Tax=hydrothermal vent metagenome TaxID=652676 RepID=A0A3B0WPQ6_9ZZZZ
MKTVNFPYLALALGLFLLLIVTKGSELDVNGVTALPLLTLLIVNECAFILTAAGIFIGLKQLKTTGFNLTQNPLYTMTVTLCILLAIQFTLLGINLWPL